MDAKLTDALRRLRGSAPPPVSADGRDRVADLQRLHAIRLPEDFAAYLAGIAPRDDWMDSEGFVWWPPARIRSLRDECGDATPEEQRNEAIEHERERYLVFADYLDWCYAYAICCSDGPNRGKVAIIGANPDRFVASSFTTFVDLAAEGSDRLHSPAGDRFTDPV